MDLPQIKKLAAQIMKCGSTRIKVRNAAEAAAQAMTKDDVRGLIKRHIIERTEKKGINRFNAKKIAAQKKKGRRSKKGSRKGAKSARTPKKKIWMIKIRALRKNLQKIKKQLAEGAYRKLYNMAKGGYFRTKEHMLNYIQEKELFNNLQKGKMK